MAIEFRHSRERPVSANFIDPEYFSLPFKGRVGVGMGLNVQKFRPIPHLTSPLKGEGLGKLMLMFFRGGNRILQVANDN
ncbi:MAG: hypothetical protein PHQ60_11930 [Sideroxydans sp.]|nr:hypothetical protein [Sideroxydans sp.]